MVCCIFAYLWKPVFDRLVLLWIVGRLEALRCRVFHPVRLVGRPFVAAYFRGCQVLNLRGDTFDGHLFLRSHTLTRMKTPITEDVIMFNPDKYQCWLTGFGAGRFGAKTETRPTDQVKDFLTRNEEGKSKREKHKR